MSTEVVIVEFTKSGGILGVTERMIISNNGHAILSGIEGANPNGFDIDEREMNNPSSSP